ncbi:MAG: SGNH/GDSL hydrolase family protein [Gemmatimonadota bacterium]
MIRAQRRLGAILTLAVAAFGPLQAQATAAGDRWETSIQRFEAADRESPPMPGAVLFVGSSSIVRWATLAEDMPGIRTLNRGFGGSNLSDVLRYADRIILPYRASHVLVYAGDNDLARGRTAEEVFGDFRALVQLIHAAQPEVPVTWISIKPSPSRWDVAAAMQRANAMVKELVDGDPHRLRYIDVWEPMLGPDGMPRVELFVEDMLHMTPAGYAVWREAVAPVVAEVLEHGGH